MFVRFHVKSINREKVNKTPFDTKASVIHYKYSFIDFSIAQSALLPFFCAGCSLCVYIHRVFILFSTLILSGKTFHQINSPAPKVKTKIFLRYVFWEFPADNVGGFMTFLWAINGIIIDLQNQCLILSVTSQKGININTHHPFYPF
jgi:hypothetical protein